MPILNAPPSDIFLIKSRAMGIQMLPNTVPIPSPDCFAVNKWAIGTRFLRTSNGTINGLVCIPQPVIFFTIWEAPSDANPARAGRPNIFPTIGSNFCPTDKIDVKGDPPT